MSKVDYSVRPAKHIERRMLAEAFRRLSPFDMVEAYRYIGFGAVYFRDFQLFHRDLGINSMISIEHDISQQKARYRFNRPFACIEMCFGHSNEILPTLPWDSKSILWLDYEDKVSRCALEDVETFTSKAVSGSVLVVTLNADADSPAEGSLLSQLEKRVGREYVPAGVTDRDLTGRGLSKVSWRILTNKIEETLHARNGFRPKEGWFMYQPLFHFQYSDGARMVTVGGILYESGHQSLLDACTFERLPFVKTGEEAYRIEVPKLTNKELRHLDAQLPVLAGQVLSGRGIPDVELQRYQEVYRYFPSFVAVEP